MGFKSRPKFYLSCLGLGISFNKYMWTPLFVPRICAIVWFCALFNLYLYTLLPMHLVGLLGNQSLLHILLNSSTTYLFPVFFASSRIVIVWLLILVLLLFCY
uniref:Uncharacterized protein n=1 Tax=Zea mays TaxID=4577 RepID=B8A0F7_MAIZE|nr:unknown [Zea mays]|eukprot:NP_001146304.1 uncharacterized protein LOC100279879 [Zea mays]